MTNSNKILVAEVPVKDGKAMVDGDFVIDGAPRKQNMKTGQARVSTIATVERCILREPGGWSRSGKCSSAVPEARPNWTRESM